MMIVSVAMTIIISNSQTSMFSCTKKPCYNNSENRILYSTKKGIPNSLRDAFSCSFVCAGYAMTAGATTRL